MFAGSNFQGAAGEIKEYNIAVEALGRAPDFDQKRDSNRAGQFHRLRERPGRITTRRKAPAMRFTIEIPQGQ